MPVVQATVDSVLLKKLDQLAAATDRTRSSYVALVLKTHVKEMPLPKVVRAIQKAWRGVPGDKKASR